MPRFFFAVLFLSLAASARAEDWPQWLGPRRDGSTLKDVKPWQGQLKVVWRQPVGEGNSSPVVVGGSVYLHSKKKNANEEVIEEFAAADGKPGWNTGYPRGPGFYLYGNGPRATPTIAGGQLYTFGITGILSCYDLKAKKQLWQVDTIKEFKAPKLFFGASCSPLIEGDHVLVNVGAKGASIVAFHKDSGNVVWKKLDDPASYAAPYAFGQGDQRQAVFLTGENVVSLSPKHGTVFWQYPFKDKANESSTTPVLVPKLQLGNDGLLLVASSVTKGSVGLKLDSDGQKPKATKLWFNQKLACYFSTPVAVGDQLYMVNGLPGKKPGEFFGSAILRCVDAKNGNPLWEGPKVGTFHASLIRTGDNKLLLLEEGGDLVLVEPNAKAFKEVARSKICGSTWSHAAISAGRLYIRDAKELICVELPQ
jgi:outer membrane protein assembly factor BamB